MADNDAAFQQSVRQAVTAYMAENPQMPSQSPVTEIVIRTGAPEAVQMLAQPAAPQAGCFCIPPYIPNLDRLPLTQAQEEAVQRIKNDQDRPGLSREQVLHELLASLIGGLALELSPPPQNPEGPSGSPGSSTPSGRGPTTSSSGSTRSGRRSSPRSS